MTDPTTKADSKIGGVFTFEHIRNGEVIDTWDQSNSYTTEGTNYVLNTAFDGATPSTTWYIGLFGNNYTPVATDTASTFATAGVANEVTTQYSSSTRLTWANEPSTVGELINSTTPADFSFTATKSVYGGFITNVPTKGAVTGVLAAAAKFASVREMEADDILRVRYKLKLTIA